MININCPNRDSVEDIENIISEKNNGAIKNNLLRIQHSIISRYSAYADIELGNRISTNTFSDDEKEALKHLYSSKTDTAKKVIDSVSKAQLLKQAGVCLSCGIGDTDQIDHFLPKEHFPEFSILHKNLVPICGTCNEIKGDNIPGAVKNYMHPMFDELPVVPFFAVSINYSESIPKVDFDIIKVYKANVIFSHFRDLKLGERLSKKSTEYFLQIKAFKNELGDDFAIEEIERDISKIGVCFGVNFWKYQLCIEMKNTDFVNKI